MGRARAAALLALLLLVPSCDWAGDSKAVRVPYAELKQRIEESHARLTRAIGEGALDQAPSATRELNARFNELSAQASGA